MDEFEIIKNFFASKKNPRSDVALGIGDDCALVEVPENQQLAITTDTLVNGVHFPTDTNPYDIAYKALAVNLSDLAAMGATPAWITLALTLPQLDESWLEEFCRGLFDLARRYNVQLIGGDLTRGPLSITLQAQGLIPKAQALKRSSARNGDLIYVSNTIGDAGLALQFLNKKINIKTEFQSQVLTRLNRPEPQIELGEKLRRIASAAIDISDGLAADLSHILEQSKVGATIFVDQLPLSNALKSSVSQETAISFALNAGDDYELCFTVPKEKENLLDALKLKITCIGQITETTGLDLQFKNGEKYNDKIAGYQHF